jgi:hypothetical protein
MADAINRIVPSSVAVDRASWKEKERQKRQGNESRAGAQLLVESAEANPSTGASEAPGESEEGKGIHLDISA